MSYIVWTKSKYRTVEQYEPAEFTDAEQAATFAISKQAEGDRAICMKSLRIVAGLSESDQRAAFPIPVEPEPIPAVPLAEEELSL